MEHPCGGKRGADYLRGKRILPKALDGTESVEDMMEGCFLAYNAARLREGAELFARKMLEPGVTVCLTLAGALTPAGLGVSCIVPLIEAGFVDWIVTTGANLYHDLHFAFNLAMHAGDFRVDDRALHEAKVVRIYDVLFSNDVLVETDRRLKAILLSPEFQCSMGTAELHHLLGRRCDEAEREAAVDPDEGGVSVLAAAYRAGVPVYTSSPGDSSIGMEIASNALEGAKTVIDPTLDVNETSAIVYHAKRPGAKSAVFILGGGSPKNFALQTEPYLQDVLTLEDKGYDYFLQVTDARPDTGGLSGATPQEAVSWGKVDPEAIPDSVVCYADTTIALPVITHYALAKGKPREPSRLYDRRDELVELMRKKHHEKIGRSQAGAAS